jgi:acid stress chaperone HdeB
MRRTLLVIAAASLGAATLPAAAQIKMDMNKITCQDMLGYNAADRTFLQYWMSGYYNAAANSDILDFKRLETNSAKVLAYCKKNKSMMLSGAINKIAK